MSKHKIHSFLHRTPPPHSFRETHFSLLAAQLRSAFLHKSESGINAGNLAVLQFLANPPLPSWSFIHLLTCSFICPPWGQAPTWGFGFYWGLSSIEPASRGVPRRPSRGPHYHLGLCRGGRGPVILGGVVHLISTISLGLPPGWFENISLNQAAAGRPPAGLRPQPGPLSLPAAGMLKPISARAACLLPTPRRLPSPQTKETGSREGGAGCSDRSPLAGAFPQSLLHAWVCSLGSGRPAWCSWLK